MKNKLGIACILLGLAVSAAAVPFIAHNSKENHAAAQSVQAVVPALHHVIAQNRSVAPHKETTSLPQAVPTPTATALGSDYLGILSIPSLSLELPIISEWSEDSLKSAPCRQAGGVSTDDLVIAGHNYADHFGSLESLQYGARLTLTTLFGEAIDYTVTSVETLAPTQVDEVLGSSAALTLYTCTYSGRERIVVRCRRIF